MARLKKDRIIGDTPEVRYFRPEGVPMLEMEEITLTGDERESIRLADVLGMSYKEAGLEMGISTSTFGRIVQRARKLLADALVNGKAIRIET